MAPLAIALLTVMTSLPAAFLDDEKKDERHGRLAVAAEAMELETRDVRGWKWKQIRIMAIGLTIWWNESRFDRRVHAGLVHPIWTSDKGKSACMGQIQPSGLVPGAEWATLAGVDLESSRRCARATIRVFMAHWRHCGRGTGPSISNVGAAYTSYAGRGCNPAPWAVKRAQEADRFIAKITAAIPAPTTAQQE